MGQASWEVFLGVGGEEDEGKPFPGRHPRRHHPAQAVPSHHQGKPGVGPTRLQGPVLAEEGDPLGHPEEDHQVPISYEGGEDGGVGQGLHPGPRVEGEEGLGGLGEDLEAVRGLPGPQAL